MGLTKISDVMASFKGLGTTEIPPLPEGALTLPEGGFKLADGTEIPAGAIDLGDGVVRLPEGMAPPSGSLRIPEGALKLPEGTTALPENVLKGTDEHGNTVYPDRPGNILKEDGTLKQHHSAAPREDVATAAETPLREPALVGAHTVANSSDRDHRVGWRTACRAAQPNICRATR